MTTRILPKAEWGRLWETGLPPLLQKAPDADVYVVEDGGRVVGCVAALRVTHLEGLWVAPEYRGNAGLGRRLIRGAKALAARCEWVWAGADTDCMRSIVERLGGVRLKLDSYVMRG